MPELPHSWSRVRFFSVDPSVDDGAWPVKRTVGEPIEVVAGIIVDGHTELAAELQVTAPDGREFAVPMTLRYNDEYVGSFTPDMLGDWTYEVEAWVDRFATWQHTFRRRVEGGEPEEELEIELQEGVRLLQEASEEAGDDASLNAFAERMDDGEVEAALGDELYDLYHELDPRKGSITSGSYPLMVDPSFARFGAWYEFFPRSARVDAKHATLDEAADLLPRIKEMGFDVVYLPPVHPIGETNRKGKDNARTAEPGDPGSPWAIGGEDENGERGGHKSVHPELGGIDAFDRFVERAEELDLVVAIDIAFQCSPDHPYVHEHPDWFEQRADGSIRYAENPPKKYEDVHPIDFESEDHEALWEELRDVFLFWIDHGVTTFRVDNPHTKPFDFWQWCIASLREEHPECVFLSEAFTKPKTMRRLAQLGFNNSYTYFTWRNTKEELEKYGRELFVETDDTEFYRPNFWPNTPDILHDYLATGGRAAHIARFVLAATMSPVYGVYGPPFEHVDNRQHPDREEYAQNEKYEIRTWNWDDPGSLQPFMQRVNEIRKEHPALQHFRNIAFQDTTNQELIAYAKTHGSDRVLVVVNLDPRNVQEGMIQLDLDALGLPQGEDFEAHDLLDDSRYTWNGRSNYIRLDPAYSPAHIFHLKEAVS